MENKSNILHRNLSSGKGDNFEKYLALLCLINSEVIEIYSWFHVESLKEICLPIVFFRYYIDVFQPIDEHLLI